MVKNLPATAGEGGSIPGSGRSPGEGNGNSLQYSCFLCHGQRSLEGYSPWGCNKSDTTVHTHTHTHAHAHMHMRSLREIPGIIFYMGYYVTVKKK